MNYLTKPKLRNVSVQRTIYRGEPVFLIQDSLKLTEAAIALPQVLGPIAVLCDGRHTIPEIYAALQVRYGLSLPQQAIENLVKQFDQALLLEGETFNKVKQKAIEAYRAGPFRKAALAGASYPANPDKLRQMLQQYLDDVDDVPPSLPHIQGIISPHIDYPRGRSVYPHIWSSAAEAVREAELVIILGTDHKGEPGTLTLTCQNYASPLGVMPTDQGLVRRLADVLGPERAFADEIHHRDEWSIELDLVWLQYLRQEKPCPMLPILCGGFHHFMLGEAEIEAEAKFKAFVEVLRKEMKQRRTVLVASGDLAHLGPAFDGLPLDLAAQAKMEKDDEVLIETLRQGDAKTFFDFMKEGQYERNVCGLSPFYFTLDTLEQTEGQLIAYNLCPADYNGTSFVSVCGIVFT